MKVNWQSVRGHALVVVAVGIGIVGMGMVFSGAMDASLSETSRGVPLLLIGLWWAGRELGRSMDASRARRSRNGLRRGVPPAEPAAEVVRARDRC